MRNLSGQGKCDTIAVLNCYHSINKYQNEVYNKHTGYQSAYGRIMFV